MSWTVEIEAVWPAVDVQFHRLALEVDPRRRVVRLGARVPNTGALDVQSGAVARSFYERGESELSAAGEWLRGPDAAELLEALAGGFHCETLWSGDPVVSWSDEAWEAGRALYEAVEARLGTLPAR